MVVHLTLDDLPQGKANCATCTNRGVDCERMKKKYPKGYIYNELTKEVGGIIAKCVNYQGPHRV